LDRIEKDITAKKALAVLTALCAFGVGAVSLEAQVDSSLLRREWMDEDHWAETYDKPLYIFKDHSDPNGERYSAFHWDSVGRVKTDRQERDPSIWFGYKILTVTIASQDKFFDHGLYDVGLAVGGKIVPLGDRWMLEASGAVSSANDGAWTNTNAIYPTATIEAVRDIAPHEFLHLGMTYNGNSELLPALPLPVVEYEANLSEAVRLRAGFPHCEAEFRPFGPEFSILMIAEYPTDARLRVGTGLGDGFRVFGEFVRRIDGFHLRESGRERIFYQLHTVDVGIRYIASWIDISLSGGWAFGQELFTGYDMRNRDNTFRPSDRPMVAINMQGTF